MRRLRLEIIVPRTRFVRQSHGELVSCSRPGRGQESIATMKKEDALFLVRVYSD